MDLSTTNPPAATTSSTPTDPLAATNPAAEPRLGRLATTKFAFVRGFYITLATVLSLRGLYAFAYFWGWCEWAINYKWRRRFANRLRSLVGERLTPLQIAAATRAHICRIRCDKTFYTIIDLIPRHKLARHIHWTGREHLDQSVARGKGTYILFSHHGSHHVGGLLLALQGYKKLAAIRDPNEGALRRFIQQRFEQTFPEFRDECTIFMAGSSFPRELYRFLKDNGILGSGLDVDHKRSDQSRTATVSVFGQQHQWLTGTVNISLRTASTILPAFLISEPWFNYRFLFYPPLTDPNTARDDDTTVIAVMQAYAQGIERHVLAYPEHISKTK